MLKLVSSIILILGLSGCTEIIKPLPPVKTYTLKLNEKNNTEKSEIKETNYSLKVYEPFARNSLNSKNIFYTTNTNQLQAYELSKWSDKPSRMLQELIIDKLSLGNTFEIVSSNRIFNKGDFILQSELVHFEQIVQKENSIVNFKIRIYLKNMASKNFKQREFEYKKETKLINSLESVVFLNETVNLFLIDLEKWLKTATK